MNAAFEATLTRDARRRGGVFNTPMAVAADAVATAIDRPGSVCDPSCGTGTFLIAAGERLVSLGLSRADAASLLIGIDIDADAVAVAAARVREWSGGACARISIGDGLRLRERSDFVVGNPPFVDRLHAQFFALAARTAERSVAMVLPQSVLATNGGRVARDAAVAAGFGVASVTRLGSVFDASVDACVVVLRRGALAPAGPTWSSLLVDDVPDVSLDGDALVGDECAVVAGFRQHYYGLRGHVREGGDGLALVTSGSIEPGSWSGRAVRFDRARYDDPRVSLDGVAEPVRSWFRSLLRPKVVVATQTRVIEAAADPRGELVPSVPVISVVPDDPDRLWHVLAVLLAPPISAWAIRSWGGTALSSSAVKLGAPQVRLAPEPAPCAEWDDAAAILRSAGSLLDAGRLMCDAYAVGEEVFAWWAARLR